MITHVIPERLRVDGEAPRPVVSLLRRGRAVRGYWRAAPCRSEHLPSRFPAGSAPRDSSRTAAALWQTSIWYAPALEHHDQGDYRRTGLTRSSPQARSAAVAALTRARVQNRRGRRRSRRRSSHHARSGSSASPPEAGGARRRDPFPRGASNDRRAPRLSRRPAPPFRGFIRSGIIF